MSHAIIVHQPGGPEVLRWEESVAPDPGPGQVRVRQTAVGVNFIDVYHRTGLYPLPLPTGIGSEAAGVVEAVGEGVTELAPGARVAYAGGPPGAYAEVRTLQADRLIPIPDGVSDDHAATLMLKGMTAEYLLHRTYAVRAGDTILVHAAAGGVGLLLCQWGRALGATVIGTTSSEEKAELARAHGAAHVFLHGQADLPARVRELTGGAGAAVVYDSVGKDTFHVSLDCLRLRGMMVLFGQSSGKVPPLDLTILSQKGGLYLTRPALHHYTHTRDELLSSARAVFDALARGSITTEVRQRWPLREAASAHAALEGRKTVGATVLVP